MLNLELARIVVAERQRTIGDRLRDERFRRDIADRNAALAHSDPAGSGSSAAPSQEAGQRAKPALG